MRGDLKEASRTEKTVDAGGSEMRKLETFSGSIRVCRVAENPHMVWSQTMEDHQVLEDHEFGSLVMWSSGRLPSSEADRKKAVPY